MKSRYCLICFCSFLIIGLLYPIQTYAQENNSILVSNQKTKAQKKEAQLPKKLIRKFKRDAARPALRLEAQKEELRYQNAVIPRDNVESIFKVLSNIYQQDQKAQSITKCNVHTYPSPSIDHFKVIFERNTSWAEPLHQGISETNNTTINDLLEQYDLVIENHQKWTEDQDIIVIRSKEPLNMAALANEFYNIEGVVEIDLGIPDVGGNDIHIKRIQDGWEVAFVLKFGAYISGNGKEHVWTYHVKDNGDVSFESETGDPLPDWMKCEVEQHLQLASTNP